MSRFLFCRWFGFLHDFHVHLVCLQGSWIYYVTGLFDLNDEELSLTYAKCDSRFLQYGPYRVELLSMVL